MSGLHQAVAPCGCRVFCTQGKLDLVTDRCGPPRPNSAYDFPQDQRGPFILHSALHQPTGSLNYTKSRNEVQRKKQVPWYGLRFWPFAQAHYISPSDNNTWPSLKSGRSLEIPGSIVQVNILFNQQYKTATKPLQIKVVASLGSHCRVQQEGRSPRMSGGHPVPQGLATTKPQVYLGVPLSIFHSCSLKLVNSISHWSNKTKKMFSTY